MLSACTAVMENPTKLDTVSKKLKDNVYANLSSYVYEEMVFVDIHIGCNFLLSIISLCARATERFGTRCCHDSRAGEFGSRKKPIWHLRWKPCLLCC